LRNFIGGPRGAAGVIVADTFELQPHADLLPDRATVGCHAESLAIQHDRGREAGDFVHAVNRGSDTIERERNIQFLRDAAQGEFAMQHAVHGILALDTGADEMRVTVMRAIEQRGFAHGRVPLGITHVETGEVDVQFGGRRAQVVAIEVQPSFRYMQPSKRSRITVMADAEKDLAVHGVVAVTGHGRVRRVQRRKTGREAGREAGCEADGA
jgi:hypothetical protein